jgi:hypothetical protein
MGKERCWTFAIASMRALYTVVGSYETSPDRAGPNSEITGLRALKRGADP